MTKTCYNGCMYEDLKKYAYAAGVIDSDGAIGIQVAKPNIREGRVTPSYRVRVRVAQCHRDIPDLFAEQFGGSVTISRRSAEKSLKWNDVYSWTLKGRNSLQFLKSIEPYLVLKGQQCALSIELIELVLQYEETFKLGLKSGHKGLKRTPEAEVAKRSLLAVKVRDLNLRQRGKNHEAVVAS